MFKTDLLDLKHANCVFFERRAKVLLPSHQVAGFCYHKCFPHFSIFLYLFIFTFEIFLLISLHIWEPSRDWALLGMWRRPMLSPKHATRCGFERGVGVLDFHATFKAMFRFWSQNSLLIEIE